MHHPLVVRRRFLQVLGVLSALATGGCAALQPGPRTVSISQEDLLQRLLAQFPLNRRLLEVFEVSLHSPQLRLIPAENRIGTELGYVIGARLPGARTTEGKLNLSYGLRFEPGDGTVRLSQVRQEGFDVPGVPQAYAAQATRLGSLLAAAVLQDFVVHRIKPEDLRAAADWGYQPGALRVVPGGLQLQLDPVQR